MAIPSSSSPSGAPGPGEQAEQPGPTDPDAAEAGIAVTAPLIQGTREAGALESLLTRKGDLETEKRGLRRRRGKELRFQILGLVALGIASAFLVVLLAAILSRSFGAFTVSVIRLDIPLPAADLGLTGEWGEEQLQKAPLREAYYDGIYRLFPGETGEGAADRRAARSALRELIPDLGAEVLREQIRADRSLVGTTLVMEVPLADRLDQLVRGGTPRLEGRPLEEKTEAVIRQRQTDQVIPAGPVSEEVRAQVREEVLTDFYAVYSLTPRQVAFVDTLIGQERIHTRINWEFFSNPNQQSPEFAGLGGAIMGSLLTLLICFVLALPIGVAAAIYLEEFAPKSRLTDLIEININNLAAVPSIIFGLLGLAVFVQFFGLPPGVPLVGGLVLALMTLPTIIIASRAAIKAVPPSIREAALGIGASRQQTIWHHVLPLAAPGILTGTIIGMAHALGETAPLIMIGMVQFVTSIPDGFTERAAVLPVQIYLWSDQPQRGFEAKTSAAIVVLLLFLIVMNGAAIWLRRRFERRW